MRRLNDKCERVFDDLQSNLVDMLETEDTEWPLIIEDAMNNAWDWLLKLPPTGMPD